MDSCPVPAAMRPGHRVDDPSALTIQMLLRELANLREVLEARFDGNDRIVTMIQSQYDKSSADSALAVTNLRTHHEEKFKSIQTQFSERDTRTEQAAGAVKIAVDAALQAQKEAVGEQNKSSALAIAKSETATTKQIDQIGITIQNTTGNLNDKIDDVKARMNVIDGRTKGTADNKDDSRSSIAIGVSVVMALVTVGAMVYASGKGSAPPSNNSVSTPQLIYVPAPAVAPAPPTK